MNEHRNNSPQKENQIVDCAARALREIHVPQGPPPEVLEAVLAAAATSANEGQKSFPKRRFRMSRIAKIAAAILIIAAVAATITLLTRTHGTVSIAWADVGAVVEKAQTICFRMTVDMGQATRYSCKTMYMEPGLMRQESENFIAIFDWANGHFLTLIPKSKSAHSSLVTALDNPYSKNWLDDLKKIVGHKRAQDIGTKEIAGRMARGWQVEQAGETVTVWADAKTAELIQVGFEDKQQRVVMSDFEFNKELDKSLFNLKPPDDYKYHTIVTMKASEPSIEDMAGLLRIWAKGSENKFPSNLNPWEFPQAAQKVDWTTEEADEATLEAMISRAFWFLFSNPVSKYVGAGVTLGDKDTVIFWHKPKGSDKYKVIYGDLNIKDVSPEDLPK